MARKISSSTTVVALSTVLLLAASVAVVVQGQQNTRQNNNNYRLADLDQFTYRDSGSSDQNLVYPPEEWDRVRCGNLDQCIGWPDSFEMGIEWELDDNYCRWCPASGGDSCGTHHQSPIDLQRNRAIAGHPLENECIDVHWMKYFDSSCTFEQLVQHNAFSVERHALKITQPVEDLGNDQYRNACRSVEANGSVNRRWGRIDFSKGFSQWWHLSHIDFHVPSEHTQEGKRYSGELQMYHYYSVSGREAGVDNQMAAVTVFLEAYDDSPDYDVLNRIICQWRKAEDRVRDQCGLPSVYAEYPGCFYYQRRYTGGNNENVTSPANVNVEPDSVRRRRRRLQHKNQQNKPHLKKAISAHDIIMHNHLHKNNKNETSFKPKTILMDDKDFEPADSDFDWDEFIKSVYERERSSANNNNDDDESRRRLLDYHHTGPWFNYFPLIGVKTEYYYRYSGTQTVPPCYGWFTPGSNRGYTNHWRVMKDPIRVSHRQINEMHRLLKERIAPPDDPVRPCQPDTAAKPDTMDPSKISVTRPLQSTHKAHFKVFCECQDWRSKWDEDKEWCKNDQRTRYYDQPYNFKTDGF